MNLSTRRSGLPVPRGLEHRLDVRALACPLAPRFVDALVNVVDVGSVIDVPTFVASPVGSAPFIVVDRSLRYA